MGGAEPYPHPGHSVSWSTSKDRFSVLSVPPPSHDVEQKHGALHTDPGHAWEGWWCKKISPVGNMWSSL